MFDSEYSCSASVRIREPKLCSITLPSYLENRGRLNIKTGVRNDSRVNKLSPSILSLSSFHPVLIELTQAIIWFLRKFREFPHGMLEDLVVNPDTGMRG